MSDTPIYDNTKNPQSSDPTVVVTLDEYTPNVKIENPDTRRLITKIAGVVGGILATAIAVDLAAPEIDYSFITQPVSAGFVAFVGYYGIAVTLPNTPKRH